MTLHRTALLLLAVLAGGLVAACGSSVPRAPATVRAPAAAPSTTTTSTPVTAHLSASGDWPEFGYDPARSDDDPDATGITAGDVGRLRVRTVTLRGSPTRRRSR